MSCRSFMKERWSSCRGQHFFMFDKDSIPAFTSRGLDGFPCCGEDQTALGLPETSRALAEPISAPKPA